MPLPDGPAFDDFVQMPNTHPLRPLAQVNILTDESPECLDGHVQLRRTLLHGEAFQLFGPVPEVVCQIVRDHGNDSGFQFRGEGNHCGVSLNVQTDQAGLKRRPLRLRTGETGSLAGAWRREPEFSARRRM